MQVFAVVMYRWGDPDGHSYLLGVYPNEEQAKAEGGYEREWRGLKYEPEITAFELGTGGYAAGGKGRWRRVVALAGSPLRSKGVSPEEEKQ